MKNRKGFSLVTTAILLVLVSAATATYMLQNQNKELANAQNTDENDDAQKLKFIETKLYNSSNAAIKLPCPADPRALKNSAEYLTAAGTMPNCLSSLPRNGTSYYKGVLPTRTLGISDNYAFDKYKNYITYAVAAGAGTKFYVDLTGNCVQKNGSMESGCSTGNASQFQSQTAAGQDIRHVLITHGKNGTGAFKKNLSSTQASLAFSKSVHQIPAPVININKSYDSKAQAANSDLYIAGNVDNIVSRPAFPPGNPAQTGLNGFGSIAYDNTVLIEKGEVDGTGATWQEVWGACSAPQPTYYPNDTETGWGTCSNGVQTRTITCLSRGVQVSSFNCSDGSSCSGAGPQPSPRTQTCERTDCQPPIPTYIRSCTNSAYTVGNWGNCSAGAPSWVGGSWSACTPACSNGTQTRAVTCPATSGTRTRSVTCPGGGCSGPVPPSSESCVNNSICTGSIPPSTGSCSTTCTNASLQFNGSSYITSTSSVNFAVQNAANTNAFTYEGWYYITGGVGGNVGLWSASCFASFVPGMSNPAFTYFRIYNNPYVELFQYSLPLNTWFHIAFVKNGTSYKLYINGTEQRSATSSYMAHPSCIAPNTSVVNLMGDSGLGKVVGYLSNFRISNIARYTTNFTSPSAPFTDDANTMLLIKYIDNNNVVRDSSSNNYSIISTGTPTGSSSSPF